MKPALISGIQPTGKLHLGNYLGALKNFVELQNSGKYRCYFFIADYHSLTADFNASEKAGQIMELAADFLAAGINPEKSTIFVQSRIPAHAELAWIFNTITPFGELSRMTQFKEKSGERKESANVGLFTYPLLMAADILLYDPQFVPVGEDQLQHLELTRAIAKKFNGRFGKTFAEPKAILASAPRLMSLSDPAKKMSKTAPAGCLFLDDAPETVREKIKRAVTDSGSEIKSDPAAKPAITNLIGIYTGLSGKSRGETEREFAGKSYSRFKEELAELLVDYFAPYRQAKEKTRKNGAKINKILRDGAAKADKIAAKKIREVKKKIGLPI